MEKPIATHGGSWKLTSPNVELEGLMDEPGRSQRSISLLPPGNELLSASSFLEMLVTIELVGNGHIRNRVLAAGVTTGRVVMAGVDLEVVGEG